MRNSSSRVTLRFSQPNRRDASVHTVGAGQPRAGAMPRAAPTPQIILHRTILHMDEQQFAAWLQTRGIETPRRIVRASESVILVSKFEPGFAARLLDAVDCIPELFDAEVIRRGYLARPGEPRVEAWRLSVAALLDQLGPPRGLDRDQLAEIRAGTDSVAALLDSALWSGPTVGDDWAPSAAELDAYADALARMDDDSSIFTRYYGDFDGRRVENHCPGAQVARRLIAQAWAICTQT